jgi:hypothetical protein
MAGLLRVTVYRRVYTVYRRRVKQTELAISRFPLCQTEPVRVTRPDHDPDPDEAIALESAALDHLEQLDEAAHQVGQQSGTEPVTFLAAHRQRPSRA